MPDKPAAKINNPITIKASNITLPRRAAGHKMTIKVPILKSDNSVAEARRLVIENADSLDTINYVYIVSKSNKLKGVVNIKDIFRKEPTTKLSEIMEKSVVWAHVETDYEKAAHLALKNNIKAIPLTDKKGHLVGVLPSDQVLAIVEHESREDLLKISGIVMGRGKLPSGDLLATPFAAFISRAPWILIGLIGATFTARIISNFDALIAEHIILASFIPLVAYVANAVGNQAQTLLIRDLAVQPKFSLVKYAIKQYITSALIGISCIVTLMAISYLTWSEIYLGFVVGIAVFAATIVATTLALVIPKILVKFDLDPATGAGPFSTVIQDLLSILIYLLIASVLI